MTGRGRFITLEGGEGVGKSTQVEALRDVLGRQGIDCLVTREPGGSPGAEAIRGLLLAGDEARWSPRAEALLFAAARADHVERTIEPALAQGRWVLCDRFLDSSLAYQGAAGGIGMAAVRGLHDFGTEDFLPDRTLVLLLADGAERARSRDGGVQDRIGSRTAEYHRAVDQAFRDIAEEEPGRVKLVDACGDRQHVTERLLAAIADLLP